MTPNTLSDRDLELLSAYLDGELDDRERSDLESRLAGEAPLREALAELRATVELVRELPRLRAPRSFALDPAAHGRRTPWWQRVLASGEVLQLAGALGSAAAVMLIVGGLLLTSADTEGDSAVLQSTAAAQPTQIGFVAEPTEEQVESTFRFEPTATSFAPIASPLAGADTIQSEDDGASVFEGEMAADAASGPPGAEMAPPPGVVETFGAAPAEPLAAGQVAQADEGAPMESAANSAAIEEQAPAPAPMLQAEQAEQPAPPSTAIIIAPTGTATPTEPAPTATLAPTAVAEKSPLAEESAQGAAPAAEDRADESDRGNTGLVALGIILLAVSIALFVFGRTKARRA